MDDRGADMTATGNSSSYTGFLSEVKGYIQSARHRANLAVNRELIALYWNVGRMIVDRQDREGWGAKVIDRLARDLKNELPEIKGFSARNLGRMKTFFSEYPDLATVEGEGDPEILPPPVAKLQSLEIITEQSVQPIETHLARHCLELPWAHNNVLIEKVKDRQQRLWYMRQTIEHGWSRDVLSDQIRTKLHERQGQAITNFAKTLPPVQSDLAQQSLKDPYIFDFLTLEDTFRERELETALVRHLQDFLVELGVGFAFVGRQYRIEVDDDDFYIDLLFYHLQLRCFVVIELKRGPFKAEYAGKLNFYLNVVDEKLRHQSDNPTIGLILCQDKKRIVAEYALRGLDKAIGISEYELTRTLPEAIKGSLPAIEELEAELAEADSTGEDG